MEKDLLEKYEKLTVNEKRNERNQEMRKISEILVQMTKSQPQIMGDAVFHNYNSVSEEHIDETEFLNITYNNLLIIRREILNYISWKEN